MIVYLFIYILQYIKPLQKKEKSKKNFIELKFWKICDL